MISARGVAARAVKKQLRRLVIGNIPLSLPQIERA